MTHQEILIAVSHFYPHIKNPNLIVMAKEELIEALDINYKAIRPDVELDCITRYNDNGFLRTITGRFIRNIGEHVIYETLLQESAHDIEKELYLTVNCTSPEAEYFVCEEQDVHKTMKEIQNIIDSFKWKVPYQVKFGVVNEHEANCT